MPEIQISGSDDDRPVSSTVRTDIDDNSVGIGYDFAGSDDRSLDGSGTCSHYCGGWQTSVYANQLSDENLRKLVVELKRKVEFTERMNWLCEYTVDTLIAINLFHPMSFARVDRECFCCCLGLSKRPVGPPHRKTSLPKHTEVKKRFMEICDRALSGEIKAALRLPAFDSYEWEDEDVLYLMQAMFIDTGLVEKFDIPLMTLREWLYEVYKHYNAVPFHNFRHCFCVAQMVSDAVRFAARA